MCPPVRSRYDGCRTSSLTGVQMYLTDKQIYEANIIQPWDADKVNPCGYDLTLGTEFKLPRIEKISALDPFAGYSQDHWEEIYKDESFPLMPHSYILGRSVEWLKLPKDVTGIAFGRSTYARAGIFCNVTPLDGGWEGNLTIAIYNLAPFPVEIAPWDGIVQVLFSRSDQAPARGYEGAYQKSKGVVESRR